MLEPPETHPRRNARKRNPNFSQGSDWQDLVPWTEVRWEIQVGSSPRQSTAYACCSATRIMARTPREIDKVPRSSRALCVAPDGRLGALRVW